MRRTYILTLCVLTAAPFAAFAQDLPAGPGADVVQQACQGCHGLDQVTSVKHDTNGWRDVVTQMINNGASLTDSQADQAVTYLSANFGLAPDAAAGATPAAAGAAPAAAGAAPAAAGAAPAAAGTAPAAAAPAGTPPPAAADAPPAPAAATPPAQ